MEEEWDLCGDRGDNVCLPPDDESNLWLGLQSQCDLPILSHRLHTNTSVSDAASWDATQYTSKTTHAPASSVNITRQSKHHMLTLYSSGLCWALVLEVYWEVWIGSRPFAFINQGQTRNKASVFSHSPHGRCHSSLSECQWII